MKIEALKYYISIEAMTVYRVIGDVLSGSPIMANNTFDDKDESWFDVDEEMMEDEHIYDPETNNFKTFGDLYAEVRKALA